MSAILYDAAIIGGGIIGCAVLKELTDQGYRCILLEKEQDLASGATGGNSGMLHTGFDAAHTSLEWRLMKLSWDSYQEYIKHTNVNLIDCGAIMIAQNQIQASQLPALHQKAQKNGVTGARILTKQEVLALEPNLDPSVVHSGMYVPGEAVIDSNLVTVTLAHAAVRTGRAQIMYSSEVQGGTYSQKVWTINTSQVAVRARYVINAAGLYGDIVDNMSGDKSKFTIKPRKGQYAVLDKNAGSLINHLILPVPSETTKGIILFKSVYGNLVVGPTAEEVDERSNPKVEQDTINALVSYAKHLVPALNEDKYKIIGEYAGVRPATPESKDYHIYTRPDRNWLTIGGIRSSGQSACLGIAKHAADLLISDLGAQPPSTLDRTSSPGKTSAWITDKPSYVLDGVEYNIRHPLMKMGLQKAKL